VTPLDQQETKVSGPPPNMPSPWSAREVTVKNEPERDRRHEPQTSPGVGQMTVPTSVPPNVARTTVEGTGALVFKVATVVLVLLALLLAGAYAMQVLNQSKDHFVPGDPHDDPVEAPPNAPIPGKATERLWEEMTPRNERRPADAQAKIVEGDDAFRRSDFNAAAAQYEAAWRFDPRPELALRLGELASLRSRPDEARGWWEKFQSMQPDAPELFGAYIDERLGH
jgi:hypothetical protein